MGLLEGQTRPQLVKTSKTRHPKGSRRTFGKTCSWPLFCLCFLLFVCFGDLVWSQNLAYLQGLFRLSKRARVSATHMV